MWYVKQHMSNIERGGSRFYINYVVCKVKMDLNSSYSIL